MGALFTELRLRDLSCVAAHRRGPLQRTSDVLGATQPQPGRWERRGLLSGCLWPHSPSGGGRQEPGLLACAQGEELCEGQGTAGQATPVPPRVLLPHRKHRGGSAGMFCLFFLPVFMLLGPDLPKEPRAGARKQNFSLRPASWKPAPSEVPERSVPTQHLTGEGQRVLKVGQAACGLRWGWLRCAGLAAPGAPITFPVRGFAESALRFPPPPACCSLRSAFALTIISLTERQLQEFINLGSSSSCPRRSRYLLLSAGGADARVLLALQDSPWQIKGALPPAGPTNAPEWVAHPPALLCSSR